MLVFAQKNLSSNPKQAYADLQTQITIIISVFFQFLLILFLLSSLLLSLSLSTQPNSLSG